MRVLDLFSGIGGFSLGLERAGMETAAFCEIDPYCRQVLRKHWPGVKIYEDITHSRFNENVELVTAGFPCQDLSYAGAGAGLTGERSGLFWYILRTLCMVGRPKLLLENVAGLLTRGLGVVLGALAAFGYDTQWHCIPASAVGAPHRRDRIWIYAQPAHTDSLGQYPKRGLIQRICQKPHDFGEADQFVDAFRSGTGMPYVCGRHDGIPQRVDYKNQMKALGNTVVPQIPELWGRAILNTERQGDMK